MSHTDHSDSLSEQTQASFAEAETMLSKGRYQDVIQSFGDIADTSTHAHFVALLGLAHFRAQDYPNASKCYQRALTLNSNEPGWLAMLKLSNENAIAKVNEFVPDIYHFARDELMAPPVDPKLPDPPQIRPLPYMLRKMVILRPLVGITVGRIGSFLFNTATTLLGRSYKGRIWTNWYEKPWLIGIFNLAYMRDELNRKNLGTTYPPNHRIAFQDSPLTPPKGVERFRTADGTWNNLQNPKEGAAHTRFLRNVKNTAIAPDHDLLDPNPRLVSLKLLTRGTEMEKVPFLNLLAACWIQFQNHDWISHGENLTDEVIKVPLPEHDPARERYMQSNMYIARTQGDPTYGVVAAETTPVTFVNEVTHWWDASQIYGSDQQTQNRLRSHVDGRLRLQADGRLPLSHLGVEDTGFIRNWWLGLAMLHNLFAREHNSICDHLKFSYPDWNDDQLFNVARLINAAVMAKIHSVEWTPAVLPNERLNTAMNSNWYGLLTYLRRKSGDRKTLAAFNIQSPELGGLVGNTINKHGCPYALTEEFVEIYRLHSFLPETLELRKHEDGSLLDEIPFVASRQAGSQKLTEKIGMANLFYSFGNQLPGVLGLNNYPKFMQELSIPGNPFFDLGTVDILRARERGVPRYNEFRRQLNMNPINRFEDLTDNPEHIARIKEVYGEDVEKLDLLIGTLAEGHRPSQFGFGETMFQIFILNASRRLQADRFFTTDYREEIYTKEGLAWIDKVSFKDVILRHHPELELTGLGNIKNAFEPWDTDKTLNPLRHPLRAHDPELKKNPWQGDA